MRCCRWLLAVLLPLLLPLLFTPSRADPLLVPASERARRVALDFPLDRAALESALRARIVDASAADIEAWTRSGVLASMMIDGERRWFRHAVGNLLRLDATAAARADPPFVDDAGPLYRAHPLHRAWLAQAEGLGADAATQVVQVDARRFRVTHRIEVAADSVPPGVSLRFWIPYPRAIPGTQEDIRLEASSGPVTLAPESDLQRSAYLQAHAEAGRPTVVWIRYALTTRTRVTRLDPVLAAAALASAEGRGDDERLSVHRAERAPHLRFTPAMRQWSAAVVGDAADPVSVARRLFAAVAAKPWAVAREYSTIDDLGLHALQAPSADCGEKAMWLITALRLNGIPARWQSGWQLSPDSFDTMHDWLEAWIAPWGWVPLDPTHGLLDSDDAALREFYFGSVDGFRIIFNDDWGQAFTPPKQHPRSEPVDAQRGEVEWDGGNLYFDQWRYRFDWTLLDPDGDQDEEAVAEQADGP